MDNVLRRLNYRVSVPVAVVMSLIGLTFFTLNIGGSGNDVVGTQLSDDTLLSVETEDSGRVNNLAMSGSGDNGSNGDSSPDRSNGDSSPDQGGLTGEGEGEAEALVVVIDADETTTSTDARPESSTTTSSTTIDASTTSAPPQSSTTARPDPTQTSTPKTPAPPKTEPVNNNPNDERPSTDPARSFERQVIELTNQHRRQAGCQNLTHNDRLQAAALGHSVDMATKGYFSHTSLDGSSMRNRIERQGYSWTTIGENIAAGYRNAESVVTGWMNSPGHRANMLNCSFAEIGVGFYEYHWTQNFGTSRGGTTPPPTDPSPPTTSPVNDTVTTTSTAPPTTKTPTTIGGNGSDARMFERQVIELTNQHRRQAGCRDLTHNDRLQAAALGHSIDMATKGYFSHTSLDGSSMQDRIERQGYSWSRIAENIAAGQRSADEVVTAWMNSSGHRANILNCQLTEIGVGFHDYNWTQNFGRPR